MILAAGQGLRMGRLTQTTPKPLLRIGEQFLLEFTLANIQKAGFSEVVINVCYFAKQIIKTIGNGQRYGLNIAYSIETEPLETGGGIVKALPLLGDQPFIVASADIITTFDLRTLPTKLAGLAHLVLVENPPYHPFGDFGLDQQWVDCNQKPFLTFGNIGVYHPELFSQAPLTHFPLNQLLFPAIRRKRITGEYYQGMWFNVGTEADLSWLNLRAREDSNLRPLVSETNTLSN